MIHHHREGGTIHGAMIHHHQEGVTIHGAVEYTSYITEGEVEFLKSTIEGDITDFLKILTKVEDRDILLRSV